MVILQLHNIDQRDIALTICELKVQHLRTTGKLKTHLIARIKPGHHAGDCGLSKNREYVVGASRQGHEHQIRKISLLLLAMKHLAHQSSIGSITAQRDEAATTRF